LVPDGSTLEGVQSTERPAPKHVNHQSIFGIKKFQGKYAFLVIKDHPRQGQMNNQNQ
jgi:hypothetical protein